MTDNFPDPIKSYTPKQPVVMQTQPETQSNGLNNADLARLDQITKEELIALVRRVGGASGAIELALLTQDEWKEATRLRLAGIAIRNPDDKVALQAIQQLLDRLEGKPQQNISSTITLKRPEEMTEAELRYVLGVDDGLLIEQR